MKINIAVISPQKGIGGGDRKFKIYYKYLSQKTFQKYLIYFKEGKGIEKIKEGYIIGENSISQFLKDKKIQYTYVSPQVGEKTFQQIRKVSIILWNVNFTPIHKEEENIINLIISKTDYWKIKWLKGKLLKNTYVVYNPIDYQQWAALAKEVKPIHKDFFKGKKIKFIVGRLGRAEPTKWNYLNIATLLKLQKEKNYNYGFIFAGMPLLYRVTLKSTLNKKMRERVLILPELKAYDKIAEFYQSIDLFWQTSRIGESFGNVIAESFCFKKPVITDFKGFLQPNGTIDPKKYDAQIELVDHNINGAYCNYPETIIKFLEKETKTRLMKMGLNGKNKVKNNYDAKFAGEKISKILLKTINKNNTIPSEKEVSIFNIEYKQRLKIARKANQINKRSKQIYTYKKQIWHGIEFIYVIIRKLLKYCNINIET